MAEQNTQTLSGKVRKGTGKGPSRRLRAEGLVPAVLYGPHSKEPVQLAVDPEQLKAAIQTPLKFNTVLTLKLEGAGEKTALLKEVQVHPVERHMLHADFVEVTANEKVIVRVPVVLTGRPAGAGDGGILNQVSRELLVAVLPKDIPAQVEVDVSPLKIGDALHVSDVKLPAGVVAKTKAEITVAVCAAPEREEVAAPTAAAAPGAEGAAAAPGAAGAPAAAAGEKKAEGGKAEGGKAEAGKAAAPAKKEEKKK